MNYEEYSVKGAKIALYPMRDVKAAMLRVTFKAGSRYEKTDSWGAMHLLEHMVHQGTRNFKTHLDLEFYKEEYGIRSNAWTSGLDLGFWFRFPSTSLNEVFNLASELIFKPSIPESQLKREQNVIRQEYRDKWSSPYNRYERFIDKKLFGENHIFIRDGMGDPDYVDTLTTDDLTRLHASFIVPENMIISLAGNFDESSVKENIQTLINTAPHAEEAVMVDQPIKKPTKNYWHKEDVDQAAFDIFWYTSGRDTLSLKERSIYNLASYILGGSSRSNLYIKLRSELGVVYGINANWSLEPSMGLFYVSGSTSKEDLAGALDAVYTTTSDTFKNTISKEVLLRSKKFITTQILLSFDSVENISSRLSNQIFFDGKIIPVEEHIDLINSVTAKEIQETISKIVEQKPFVTIMSREKPSIL